LNQLVKDIGVVFGKFDLAGEGLLAVVIANILSTAANDKKLNEEIGIPEIHRYRLCRKSPTADKPQRGEA